MCRVPTEIHLFENYKYQNNANFNTYFNMYEVWSVTHRKLSTWWTLHRKC